jgi:hypothetical protein
MQRSLCQGDNVWVWIEIKRHIGFFSQVSISIPQRTRGKDAVPGVTGFGLKTSTRGFL